MIGACYCNKATGVIVITVGQDGYRLKNEVVGSPWSQLLVNVYRFVTKLLELRFQRATFGFLR